MSGTAGKIVTLGRTLATALLAGVLASAAICHAAAQSAAPPTIAVLPLENSSGEATQDFFAEAMTDELASALTGIHGLGVVARSSVFQFKPAGADAAAIGRALNASFLVQGSARLAGDRVHLNLRAIEARDGAVLWSQDYDIARSGVFDAEEGVARELAGVLKVPVDPGEAAVRSRTGEFETYLDFLHAKVAARARGVRALADAATILERVVARDPDFAPAAALLAYDYALTPLFAVSLRGGMPEEERKVVERTIPRSDALARHATAIDPKGADGFVALGYAYLVQRKMLAAEDAFRQALALNPNQADGLHGYSQLLAAMGRIKDSLAMRGHLQAIEQFITNYTADTAEIVWLDGDTAKALAILEPFRPGRTLELALIEASAGRYREAAVSVRQIPASNYPAGMTEAAANVLESAPARTAAPAALPRLGNLSFAYMHVGAPERVLEFYEDEISGGYFQPISTTWFWHPTYAAVRRTQRFKTVVRELGLLDYWKARGWPAQCHPEGAEDFACE